MSRLQKTGQAKEVSSTVKRKLSVFAVGALGLPIALAATEGKPEQQLILNVIFFATVVLLFIYVHKTRRNTSSRVTADAKKIVEGKVVK